MTNNGGAVDVIEAERLVVCKRCGRVLARLKGTDHSIVLSEEGGRVVEMVIKIRCLHCSRLRVITGF